MAEQTFLADPPRFLFFTGKGGVGKTSLACATAIHLVDHGKRVLLVSTDPASNLAQVFEQPLGSRMIPIASVPGLDAVEIDPQSAAEHYREKVIGPLRDTWSADEITAMTEQLSGSCTTEVASFNEFTDLLADDSRIAPYDHVIFDTAPTGHTIRLLHLPGEWTAFLENGKGDASCLGPMSGLDKARTVYAEALQRLADPTLTRLILVSRAQEAALAEAGRTALELADVGLTQQHLVINALLPDPGPDGDALAIAIHRRETAAMAYLPDVLRTLPTTLVPMRPLVLVGVRAIRSLLTDAPAPESVAPAPRDPAYAEIPALDALVEELATADHGLVMCMGKGGVGKTTVAAALALALAARGKMVHLSTTDPAAHLTHVLGGADTSGLTVSRIDPAAAIETYRTRVLATKGAALDDDGRARLTEDLLSPCTEEVAVFGEFSHLVSKARRQFVVMDTAPTGHTLLLLDTTGSYHRDIVRNLDGGRAVTPLMRLQDPKLTHMVLVTLPEATPMQEAADLQDDLARAGITPWAWVVNQSLSVVETSDPLLRARAAAEAPHLARVRRLAPRLAALPLLPEEPVGAAGLRHLFPEKV